MISPYIRQQLASQHIADLRLEAESERIGRRARGERRQAARRVRLSNVRSVSRSERVLSWLSGYAGAGGER